MFNLARRHQAMLGDLIVIYHALFQWGKAKSSGTASGQTFMCFQEDTNCQLTFANPVRGWGFLGIGRMITHMNLSVDDVEQFQRAIAR
ncbi:hypothetical protein [Paenibacillus sp. MMS18-CY102]|uniref:hypothetical protein n=1 Tax=Paenibacillus sp. MMS18-CY102 TaxID=2682849 RepID=UPI001365BD90|nr:hypothetical protein [Paenibacillus sp. MMS18-CY102]MWC27565.1 hypothetical protein [Paenibacillus sp. MMS18-CY102]